MINFTADPSFPAELDRVYKITEGVMRSLIVPTRSNLFVTKKESVLC